MSFIIFHLFNKVCLPFFLFPPLQPSNGKLWFSGWTLFFLISGCPQKPQMNSCELAWLMALSYVESWTGWVLVLQTRLVKTYFGFFWLNLNMSFLICLVSFFLQESPENSSVSQSDNVRRFLATMDELGIPRFEVSDLEKVSINSKKICNDEYLNEHLIS